MRLRQLALVSSLLAFACSEGEHPSGSSPDMALAGVHADLMLRLDSAHSLYKAGTFEAAAASFEDLLDNATVEHDSFVETEALTWLALTDWNLASYDVALERAERALRLKQQYGLSDSLFRSHNSLGLIHYYAGRLSNAATHYDSAAAEAARLDDVGMAAAVASNRGLLQHDLGEFEEAASAFRELRDAGVTLGIPRYEANGLTNLGMVSVTTGDPEAAVPMLESAIAIYRDMGHPNEQIALGQLSEAYAALGRSAEAYATLHEALALSRATDARDEEALNLEALATHYRTGGDLVRARVMYDSALGMFEELGMAVASGAASRSIAEVFFTLEDPEHAREWLERAVRLHEEAGDLFELFGDHCLLAELNAFVGRSPSGALAVARAIAHDFDAPSFTIQLALTEARIAEHAGDAASVTRILEPLVDGEIRVSAPASRAEIDALLSWAYGVLGNNARAIDAGRSAVNAFEQVREGFGSSLLRTSFVTHRASLYGNLAMLLIEADSLDLAFEVIDAARGRALLEHAVASNRGSGSESTSTVTRLAEAESLLRSMQALSARVEESETGFYDVRNLAEEDRLMDRLVSALERYEMLVLEAIDEDRPGTSLLGQTTVTLEEVKSVLRSGEVVVEYLADDDNLIVCWISATDAGAIVRNGSGRGLATKVRVARELLATADTPEELLLPVLQDLHQLLVEPVRSSLEDAGANRIVVVPHSYLHYLPFAALHDPKTGAYLVDDFELTTIPSAAAIWALRSRPETYSTGDGRLSAVAFSPLDRLLPATREEINAIKRSLDRVTLRRGRRATERAVRDALQDRSIVHVATHTVLNPRSPLFSAVELARGRGGSHDNDGRLELHEVLNIQTQSGLVFLSGCETGVGVSWATRFTPGEDYATLARAFLFAGAQNVVSTLWRINDRGASQFAGLYYRFLDNGDPVAALAKAQRAALSGTSLKSPHHWAAYVISGSGRSVSSRN